MRACAQRFEQNGNQLLWFRAAKRGARCTGRREQGSEPTPTASSMATKRCTECAQPVLVFCILTTMYKASGPSMLTTLLLSCCSLRYEYVSTERHAPSALLLVFRPEPAPAGGSLAAERRADRRLRVRRDTTSRCPHPTHRSCCCVLLYADNILSFRDHAIFRFENLLTKAVGFWGQNLATWAIDFSNQISSSDFGPKSDDYGHRILKSFFVRQVMGQNLTAWAIGLSNHFFFSGSILHIRTAQASAFIFGIENYYSEARNWTA